MTRRSVVLGRMKKLKYITDDEAKLGVFRGADVDPETGPERQAHPEHVHQVRTPGFDPAQRFAASATIMLQMPFRGRVTVKKLSPSCPKIHSRI